MNTILLVFVTVAAGWLAALAGNWAADHLPAYGAGGALALARNPDEPGLRRGPTLVLAMMAAFAMTAARVQGDPLRVLIAWSYVAFLLTVLVIDFEQRRVLNVMVGPAAVVVVALSLLPQTPTLEATLLGGVAGLALFLLVYVVSRGHLGLGDVKLAGLIGLMLGFPAVVWALVLGIILGAAAALFLLVTKRATRKSYMAYAPYLALGAIAAIWWFW